MNRGKLLYWYCDIIDYEKGPDKITIIDLLADVKVYADGSLEVLDLDELEEALKSNLITSKMYLDSIKKLNRLIRMINDKNGIENLVDYLLKTSE